MINGNGHTNGKPIKPVLGNTMNGTSGSYSPGSEIDTSKPREVRMLCRSIMEGWLREAKDPQKMAQAIRDLDDAIEHCKKGSQVHAIAARAKAQCLVDIMSLGVRVAEFEDKIERLDGDKPTERVEHFEVIIPEARSRISE